MVHDVENENDAETKNVVVAGYYHDRANETLLRGARQDGQANLSPPYTEHPMGIGSIVESYDASAA